MATLEIKKYPDPILRKTAKEIKEITPEIKNLVESMKETTIKNNGAGLSAQQVGSLWRVIVIQTEKGPIELLNPVIVKMGKEKVILEEGCLSFPGLWLKIKRPKEVEVRARDIEEGEVLISAKGLQSRIIQHEIDHLDGVLYIDRLRFFERMKLRKKIKEFVNK